MEKDALVQACQEILAQSSFSETEVTLRVSQSMLTRYGDNHITQNVDQHRTAVSLRAIERAPTARSCDNERAPSGAKTARVECDQVDRKNIAAAYARLAKIIKVLPPSQEVAPLHSGGDKPSAQASKSAGAMPEPEQAPKAIELATGLAATDGFSASGVYSADRQISVFANSAGVLLADDISDSEFTCTIEGKGGAGRGFSNVVRATEHDPGRVVARALEKCRGSVDPVALEPGYYDVVLEPAASAEMLVFFGWVALSAKAYVENRSFCRGKLGEKILSEKISLIDDPLDPAIGGATFDGQGLAKRKITLVENGVLKELASDLKTALKLGRQPTGHGLGEPNASDPVPWNIGLEWAGPQPTGVVATGDLISKVKRGILVTQFHYTNVVDPMVPSVTGMTRNGTFLIENGKVTKPIRNMRFTQSLVDLFKNVEAISTGRERVSTFFAGASLAPSMLVRGFHFSSGTGF